MNCCELRRERVTLAGETVTEVITALTCTDTALLVERPPASAMVTENVYAPGAEKVAVVFLAALVPLAENAAVAGPETDQV